MVMECRECGMRYHTHCVSCHRSFAGDTAFDGHLTGPMDARRCVDVEDTSGWRLNRYGYWTNSERDPRWVS